MDELLIVSILLSLLLNIFLFFFLYNKRRSTEENRRVPKRQYLLEEPELIEVLEAEIHKVERYNEYCFSLVTLVLETIPSSLLSELRTFIRKSDSVYMFEGTVYLIFPFSHIDNAFRKKVNKRLINFIQSKHPDIELLKVHAQECNIYEILKLDEILKRN